MHTIRVKADIDCSAFMPEEVNGLATTSFYMTYNIDLTDEQWEYLSKEEEAKAFFEDVDFWDLRADFQEMADRLTQPYINFIYQQFLASGAHPANIERYLECMECTVCHDRDDDDDDCLNELCNEDSYLEDEADVLGLEDFVALPRVASYDDIYRTMPQIVASREEMKARNFLISVATEGTTMLSTSLGHVIVVRIPACITPSGLIVEYLALARQGEHLAYFTIENDEGEYFLDEIQPERHSTFGVQWTTPPTMQQIAERIQEIMNNKSKE